MKEPAVTLDQYGNWIVEVPSVHPPRSSLDTVTHRFYAVPSSLAATELDAISMLRARFIARELTGEPVFACGYKTEVSR